MDNNKKKAIVGAGILAAAGLAIALTRKKAPGQPEGIELSNLSITPTTVAPGEPVTISVLVTNHTDGTLGFVVNLTGDFIDSEGGFLDAGQSTAIAFTVIPPAEKTYNVKVDGLSGSFLCTSLPHGDIVLSDLVITPNPCITGDTVTVSVTATNHGSTTQAMMVTMVMVGDKYNDKGQQSHQILLSPGVSQVVIFTFRPTVAETYQITVDGVSGSLVVNPGPSWPGWTEGTSVYELSVEPATVFLGESTSIRVYIMGPWPADYEQGVTIEATIDINGETLSKTYFTHIRNPTLYFTYTPTATGTFTVTAQDKMAAFTVVANPLATYYSPFGGVRMPIITDLLIPDVEPFTASWLWGEPFIHPGGDLKFSDIPANATYYSSPARFVITMPVPASLVAKLPYASPLASTPDATINTWVSALSQYEGYGPDYVALKIMPLDYQCQPHWNSKLELMEMIARSSMSVPVEWIEAYGTICPTCNGTGQITPPPPTHWEYVTCPTCKGLGKVLNVDPARGIKDVQVPIAFKSDYSNEVYHYYIFCPYCGGYIASGSSTHQQNSTHIREDSTRYLINHIEAAHPTHPLTEPAWF